MEGTTITAVRKMNDDECERMYWPTESHRTPRVLELSDGSVAFPSTDPEGNAPGFFSGLPDTAENVEGNTIRGLSPITDANEVNRNRRTPPEIHLSSGVIVTPLADPEGNGYGALYLFDDGQLYEITVS